MRIAGIVCECNPFHDGHRRLLRKARENGAEMILCTLSDPFVERGEPALLDARVRAEALVRGGADVVVSLPFPYAAAGAEVFARAGVEILCRLGIDELWFGSECGNLTRLSAAAEAMATQRFRELYTSASPARGRAAAFFDALQSVGISGDDFSSNDLLGIAYLRALQTMASSVTPHAVLRRGTAYNDPTLTEGVLPSATALRQALLEGSSPETLSALPIEARTLLAEAFHSRTAPAEWKNAERAVLAALRLFPQERIASIAALGGGLGNRILHAAQEAGSWEELLMRCANRTYTDARIRRGILYALCGVTEEHLRTSPAWVRLLAANREGCRYLASRRKEEGLPVVTKAGEIPTDEASLAAAAWERRAYDLWSLCLPEGGRANDFLKQPPRILN